MPRIREQGEAAGEEAADDLGDREGAGEGENDRERPAALAALLVRVFVCHGDILPPRYLLVSFARFGLGSVFAVLAHCEPEAKGYLGRAYEAHVAGVVGEEAGGLADALGADLPQ